MKRSRSCSAGWMRRSGKWKKSKRRFGRARARATSNRSSSGFYRACSTRSARRIAAITILNVRPVVPFNRAAGDPELIWMSGVYYRYDLFGTGLRYLPKRDVGTGAGGAPVPVRRISTDPSRGHADHRRGNDAGASSPGGSVPSSGGAIPPPSGGSTPSMAVGGASPAPVGNALPSMENVVALAARVCNAELGAHVPGPPPFSEATMAAALAAGASARMMGRPMTM